MRDPDLKAKQVTKLDLVNNRLAPNAIEPRAAIGEYDSGTNCLTLWNTTQNPHVARLVISAFVGICFSFFKAYTFSFFLLILDSNSILS